MKRTLLRTLALSLSLAVPALASAQVTINFDGSLAPCNFGSVTAAFTGQFGVSFNAAGAVLDQCANFAGVPADHTPGTNTKNFLAVSPGAGLSTGALVSAPLTLTFGSTQTSFTAFVSQQSKVAVVYSLLGVPQQQSYTNDPNTWTQVFYSGSFDKVTFGAASGPNGDVTNISVESVLLIDDISTTGPRTTVPEPGTWALMTAGLLGLAAARRRRNV